MAEEEVGNGEGEAGEAFGHLAVEYGVIVVGV